MEFTEVGGLPDGEQLLEYRSFNRHAAIYKFSPGKGSDPHALDPKRIRNRVKKITRPNILRGLAFGVFISTESLPPNLDDLFAAIDTLQNERSVWQWTIIAIDQPRMAIGFHTWMTVSLTPYFDKRLSDLQAAGYAIEQFTREKGKLTKVMLALQPNDRFEDYRGDIK